MANGFGRPETRVEAHALAFLSSSPIASARVGRFFPAASEMVADLTGTDAFQRLSGVSQLGIKRGTRNVPALMQPFCGGRTGDSVELPSFSRRDHSERACGMAVALCALHRLPEEDTRLAAAAALCHDIGHPAFSHTVEPILARRGIQDHEAAGREIVVSDPEIQGVFARHGIDTGKVIAIMREEGDIGLRQSLVDSCTYVWHDSENAGFSMGPHFVWSVLRQVHDARDGAFDSDDLFMFEDFLWRRAELHATLYEHPLNRFSNLMLREAADWLVDAGRLDLRAVSHGTDAAVTRALSSAAQNGAPAWVRSAWGFLSGRLSEHERWGIRACHDAKEAAERASDGTAGRPSFVIHPVDMTGKTLPIRLPDGEVVRVRAPKELRPDHHRVPYVVSYLGPE